MLSQVYNEPIQRPAPSWLNVSSVGKSATLVSQRSCKGLNPVQIDFFFQAFFSQLQKFCLYNCDNLNIHIIHPTVNIYDFHILTSLFKGVDQCIYFDELNLCRHHHQGDHFCHSHCCIALLHVDRYYNYDVRSNDDTNYASRWLLKQLLMLYQSWLSRVNSLFCRLNHL